MILGVGHKDLLHFLPAGKKIMVSLGRALASASQPDWRIWLFKSSHPYNAEKSDSKCCRTFLAGAQGLEPWAYGFGDRRSTNWAIPLCKYKGRNRPYFLWWAFRDSNPGLSGYEPEALTNWAKGPWSRVLSTNHLDILAQSLGSVKNFLCWFLKK